MLMADRGTMNRKTGVSKVVAVALSIFLSMNLISTGGLAFADDSPPNPDIQLSRGSVQSIETPDQAQLESNRPPIAQSSSAGDLTEDDLVSEPIGDALMQESLSSVSEGAFDLYNGTPGTSEPITSASEDADAGAEAEFALRDPVYEENGDQVASLDGGGDDLDVMALAVARSIPTSTDLSQFLVTVACDAPTDENGNYVIDPNATYGLALSFAENQSLQFDDTNIMAYQLPAGLMVPNSGPTSFGIEIADNLGQAVVLGNTFQVANGVLTVRFNQDDPNFNRLTAVANANFSIDFAVAFDGSAGSIAFNPLIEKEFVYEVFSDLGISKSVAYDAHNDVAHYELLVVSTGPNDNVLIQDTLSGTALILNHDVSVVSSMRGQLAPGVDFAGVEYDDAQNSFALIIPSLENGEVLTLSYSAQVDNDKITGRGTMEQTSNTARVSSVQVPEGKEASANFSGQVNFHKITKRASGEPQELADGIYQVTWRIVVNEDHKLTVGGEKIYDWIRSDSRSFMTIADEPLIVNVRFEDGSTEQRTVPLSDLHLYENSGGVYGWMYQTPHSDGKAAYEIIGKTIVDVRNSPNALSVFNSAQVGEWSYTEASASVGVIGEDALTATKEALGTTSTESTWAITVQVPGNGLPDFRIVDDLPRLDLDGQMYLDTLIEDSLAVEGLLPNESYSVRATSDGRSFTLAFYQDESMTTTGLRATPDGSQRTLTITFKTAVNQDWLARADESGYTSYQAHRNIMSARVFSAIMDSDSATVVPVKPSIEKSAVESTRIDVDGVSYPAYRYKLLLQGLLGDGVQISDRFDTTYLRVYEADGVRVEGGNAEPYVAGGSAFAESAQDGALITISEFPKDANGRLYRNYAVYYTLIAKDQAALDSLNQAALDQGGEYALSNQAVWGDLASNQVTVTHSYYPYVDKTLIQSASAQNDYIATFVLVINEYADDLDPTSDVLNVQDELSGNLRLLPDTVVITPADASITMQFDSETNTLTLSDVPDETRFEITYQARVLGAGETAYSNTIRLGSYSKTVEDEAFVESSGSGSGSNPSITLVKVDASDLSKRLSGAVFQLASVDDQGGMAPITDRDGNYVYFETGSDGSVLVEGNQSEYGWTLWSGQAYALVEVASPFGYELTGQSVFFTLVDVPSGTGEYLTTGDSLTVQNARETIDIPVSKTWVGRPAGPVTVRLFNDSGVEVASVVLSEENGWQAVFEGLARYDVENKRVIGYEAREDPVIGYETMRLGSADEGFAFTNAMITTSFDVRKQWIGPADGPVTIDLLADGVLTGKTVELSDANNWMATFHNLPRFDSADGHEIAYDVRERPMEGYESHPVLHGPNDVTFINYNNQTRDIPVLKIWVGEPLDSVVVKLEADHEVVEEVVLSEDNDWMYVFENLPIYDPVDGHIIFYWLAEEPLVGYRVSLSTDTRSFVLTNYNISVIQLQVNKVWEGQQGEEAVIHLWADGIDTGRMVVLNSENDWRGAFEGLLQFDQFDGHRITYTVQEEPLEGYTSRMVENAPNDITFVNTRNSDDPPAERYNRGGIPRTGDSSVGLMLALTAALASAFALFAVRKR